MFGWIFRGCLLAVLALFVLFVLILLGSMGVINVQVKTLAIAFCIIAGVLFFVPVLIGLAISMFFKKLGNEIDKFANAAGGASSPAEVTVVPLDEPWDKPAGVTRAVGQLASLGFVEIGEFGVEEMPGVKMHAMHKPVECVWAAVCEMNGVDPWVDLVIEYQDGGSLTVGNAKMAGVLDPHPGHEKVIDRQADAVGLYDLFKARSHKPAVPTSPERFKPMFEKAYRDEMAWRAAKGGASRDEIRRVAALTGDTVSDDVLDSMESQNRAEARERLEEILRKTFLDSGQITAAKWEDVSDRVVFIHDQMPMDEAMELLADEDVPTPPAGASTTSQAFFQVNKGLPVGRRCELIGHLDEPVPCDIYAMPE